MSMMDFASALGGAGGAPPGGLPPGAPDPSGGLGAAPPDVGAPPPDAGVPPDTGQGGQQFSNSLEALDAAEEALHAFIQLDPDEADRAAGAQALQAVLKLKASNADSAQSGDLKSLRRALAGGPQANGGPIGQALSAGAAGP